MIRKEELMPYANRQLVEIIKEKTDGNVQKFAEEIGMSQQRINRLLVYDKKAERYPGVSDEVRNAVIETYGIDPGYFDLPPNMEDVPPLQDLHEDFERMKKCCQKPHIPMKVAAAYGLGFADCVMKKQCQYKPIISMFPPYDLTIDLKDDNMLPKYEPGDILAIKQMNGDVKPGHVYVIDTSDGAVLSRVYKKDEGYLCVSYNKEYGDFFVDKASVYGVYKIIGLIRI